MKKPIKIILIVLAVLVGLFAALLIWLTATQLNVKTETAVVTRGDNSTAAFAPGDEVSILSWNVGYAGLGEESDFFMDGGKQTRAPSKAIVEKNMDGIVATVQGMAADFTFLQEIDAGPSTHAYGIEEAGRLRTETQLDSAHALNYKCAFVPYPIPPGEHRTHDALDRADRLGRAHRAAEPVQVAGVGGKPQALPHARVYRP